GPPDPRDVSGISTRRLDDRTERLRLAADRHLRAAGQRLDLAAARLRPAVLAADLDRTRTRLAEVEPRLNAALARFIGRSRDAVDNFAGRLATHAERHERLLARGYVVVRNAAPKLVPAAGALHP